MDNWLLIICGLPVYLLEQSFGYGYHFNNIINYPLLDHVICAPDIRFTDPKSDNDN